MRLLLRAALTGSYCLTAAIQIRYAGSPTSSSLVNGQYTRAVSKKVMPS